MKSSMIATQDIPSIPNRRKRFEELFADCYGQSEELSAMEVYFTDAMTFPFEAEWRDLDEPGHSETVTVTGVADVDERRGVLLTVRRVNGKERRVVADCLSHTKAQLIRTALSYASRCIGDRIRLIPTRRCRARRCPSGRTSLLV